MSDEAVRSLLALPAHLRKTLAAALASGFLGMDPSVTAVRAALRASDGQEEQVLDLLDAWRGLGVGGRAAAAWIRSLEQLAASFSAPTSCGPARRSPASTPETRGACTTK